jgi:hypothetical protein
VRPTADEVAAAVSVLARVIAYAQLETAREADSEWIDLRTLALGRKRGPELCRRWLSAGRTGVIQVGRDWRVHRSVLDEFLGGVGAVRPPKAEGALDRIQRRLAVVGGAR